jgi:sugar (pentulose or hexulose) kinase
MGAGTFDDWDEIERFIEMAGVVEPNRAGHTRYRRLFGIYRDLYESLKPHFVRLAEIGG